MKVKRRKAFAAMSAGLTIALFATTSFGPNAAFGTPEQEPELVPNMPEEVAPRGQAQPTPTPEPDPDKCPYAKATMSLEGWDISKTVKNPFEARDLTNSCVAEWTKGLATDCPNTPYCDDQVAAALASKLFGPEPVVVTDPEARNDDTHFQVGKTLANGSYCISGGLHHFAMAGDWIRREGDSWKYKITCMEGYAYFHRNEQGKCEVVPESEVRKACGDNKVDEPLKINFIKSSPISLLWTPDADIEQSAAVSTFPLNPAESGKWYAWRGSAKTPLLVYDPAHNGTITSAEQLFGNWTFGGKRTASMTASVIGQPWRDGYEALAVLDRNQDGKISGSELEPLGLWFDENQDAVAQPGEVKAALETDLRALYYQPDNRGSGDQHVRAARGFARKAGNKIEIGPSVDWFAESASNAFELTGALILKGAQKASLPAPELDPINIVKSGYGKQAAGPSVAGVWKWNFEDPRAVAAYDIGTQGMLVLSASGDSNEVEGYSLTVSNFANAAATTAAERAQAQFLRGTKTGSQLSFEIRSRNAKIKSEAVLSDDGRSLKGTSTVTIDIGGGLKKISYKWTADRIG